MAGNCLGVTAIWLGITGVGLFSTIVAAPAVIGMEAVSIVMGLLRIVGNQAINVVENRKTWSDCDVRCFGS